MMTHLFSRQALIGTAVLAIVGMARPSQHAEQPAKALLAHDDASNRIIASKQSHALEEELARLERRFGPQLLKDFQLADGYVNFNHGSFGSLPRQVTEMHVYASHVWLAYNCVCDRRMLSV